MLSVIWSLENRHFLQQMWAFCQCLMLTLPFRLVMFGLMLYWPLETWHHHSGLLPLLAGKGSPCTYRATGMHYQDKWLLTYPTYFNIPQACCATSNQRRSSEHWVPKPRSLRTVSVPLSSLGKVGYKNPSDQHKVDYGSQSGVPEAPGLLTQTVGGGAWESAFLISMWGEACAHHRLSHAVRVSILWWLTQTHYKTFWKPIIIVKQSNKSNALSGLEWNWGNFNIRHLGHKIHLVMVFPTLPQKADKHNIETLKPIHLLSQSPLKGGCKEQGWDKPQKAPPGGSFLLTLQSQIWNHLLRKFANWGRNPVGILISYFLSQRPNVRVLSVSESTASLEGNFIRGRAPNFSWAGFWSPRVVGWSCTLSQLCSLERSDSGFW